MFNLSDFWRLANEKIKRYTWRRQKPQLIQSRLDYWIISNHIYHRLEHIDILPGYRTDHSAISMRVQLTNDKEKRGPGLWTFNSNILSNPEYVVNIAKIIEQIKLENNTMNAHLKWELIKYKIREWSITFAKKQAQQRRKTQKELYNKLDILEQRLDVEDNQNNIDKVLNEINTTRLELEHFEKLAAYGHYIRSKAFFLEHDQKNSAVFFNLEKKGYENKNIKKLLDNTGNIVTNAKGILQTTVDFYKLLYSVDEKGSTESYHDFVQPSQIPQINNDSRDIINKPLTETELKNAVKSMKCNKTPGSDGLTKEFYEFFWSQIKDCLMDSYCYSFKQGYLSCEQRRGVIRLIPKKDKDPTLLKNYQSF